MPIVSNQLFTDEGYLYNVSAVLDSNLRLNETAYDRYGMNLYSDRTARSSNALQVSHVSALYSLLTMALDLLRLLVFLYTLVFMTVNIFCSDFDYRCPKLLTIFMANSWHTILKHLNGGTCKIRVKPNRLLLFVGIHSYSLLPSSAQQLSAKSVHSCLGICSSVREQLLLMAIFISFDCCAF